MKHAFLIVAHHEFELLKILIEMLDQEDNSLFVHIDLRATALYEAARSISVQRASLHLLENRISVYWGDISQVEVEYLLLETATVHGSYAYYHLLSGVDLPIQTVGTIHRFFAQHAGKEFVSFWRSPSHLKDLNRKIERYYFFTRYRRSGEKWHALFMPFFNLFLAIQKGLCIRRKKEVVFQKGPNWFSITSDFCQYVLAHKAWVLKRFQYTLCPDEIFLQTLLINSPFRDCIYDDQDETRGNQREIDWKRGHPYVWQDEDFELLVQSDKLFARKFSSASSQLIEKLYKRYG